MTTFEADASCYIPPRRLERLHVVYPGDDVDFGPENKTYCEVDSYGLGLKYTKKVNRYKIPCHDPTCCCKGKELDISCGSK